MTDLTIGAVAASALALAGEAIIKGAVGEVVKDCYGSLKTKIGNWAAHDIFLLEETPASTARQAVIAETIDRQLPEEQNLVRTLADRLLAAMKDETPRNIGLDVGRLDALVVRLGNITVVEGTGARFGEIKTEVFEAGNVQVGGQSGKKT